MDQTHSTSQSLSSTQDPYHGHGMIATIFRFIAPLNLTLASYIVLQNTTIICHYYSARRRLTTMLVILIASVDVLNAMTELTRGSVSLLCLRDVNNTMRIASWLPASYVGFGVLCNSLSIFFYTVLSVVKTINIVNPFLRIKNRLVKIILLFVSTLGLAVTFTDVLYFLKPSASVGDCGYTHWDMIVTYSYVSEMIFLPTLTEVELTYFAKFFLLVVPTLLQYILPCILVFVCMIIQVFVIHRAVRNSPNVLESQARHANITILLITALFLISNGTLAIATVIYLYYWYVDYEGLYRCLIILVIRMVSQYTLPLINAAIFPIIIILRNTALRETYKSYILCIIRIPVLLCCLFMQFRQHRRNEMESSHAPRSVPPVLSNSRYTIQGTGTATDRSFVLITESRSRSRAHSI